MGKTEENEVSPVELKEREEELAKSFPEATPEECRRFLVARDGSLEGATKQLKGFMEWRELHKVDEDVVDKSDDNAIWTFAAKKATGIECEESIDLPRVVRTYERDGKELTVSDGTRAIMVMPAQIDSTICPSETYALAMAFYLYHKVDRNTMDKDTVLLDVRAGVGWPNESAYSLFPFIKRVASLLNNHYPECLNKLLLYPMPSIALSIWKAAKLFLDPDTASKIILIKGSDKEEAPAPKEKMLEFMDEGALQMFEDGRAAAFKEPKKKKGFFG